MWPFQPIVFNQRINSAFAHEAKETLPNLYATLVHRVGIEEIILRGA